MVISYKRFRDDTPFDVIVIGSGMGGLGLAAILARAAGRRVLVLERHYTAGGLTHAFRRRDLEWDVGVHYVGDAHVPGSGVAMMLDYVTEGRLQWAAMPDAYDRIRIGGLHFDYVSGRDRLRDALVRTFPREITAVDRYFAMIASCLRRVPFYFVEKTLPATAAALAGAALRAPFLRLARRTTGDVLRGLGASADLAAVLAAQWGDYGLPPGQSSFAMHAIVTAHYFNGGAYPVGGASKIARSIVPVIERAGGAVVVDADVERVLVFDGRAIGVRMHDGRELRAPAVVSDAGVRLTYERLLGGDMAPRIGDVVSRTRTLPASLAHLSLYVGVDTARITAPPAAGNIWVHPGVDFDVNLQRFLADIDAPFPFVYISFPSAKDPTFAARHPGKQTIELVTLASFDQFAPWNGTRWHHRGEAYEALKERLAARLLETLYAYEPGVRGAVESWELSTPLSTRHFIGTLSGEIYGLAHGPERFASRDLRPRTPIAGLYLTGQDVSTCGVMGAFTGAVTTASAMLGRNMFSAVAKGARG